MKQEILVLGGGIAGCTTAIGLKKLGFGVKLFYKSRPFVAYEGFSDKTKEGLQTIGCTHAAKLFGQASLRNSNWGEKNAQVNHEFVVCRKELDEALLKDATACGVQTIEAHVIGSFNTTNKPSIEYKKDSKTFVEEADFIVDARGRFTPYKNEYTYGPKSYSILQEIHINDAIQSKTSIDSIEDGWVWQAHIGSGKGYIQFSCDEAVANTISSFEDMLPYLKEQDIDLWTLSNFEVKNKIVKRDSYSKIHNTIVNDKYLLVGDAASSIDPLSGNGAFQAMSVSSIAPYVINTILNDKQNSHVAIEFYKQRVNFIFNKFSHIGKEFYLLEKRFKSEYWSQRQSWPKEPQETLQELPRVEQRAILKAPFICPQEIVVTKDNPMGVWLFDNFDIVELTKYCLKNSKEKALEYFRDFCKINKIQDKQIKSLQHWMHTQGVVTFSS